MDKQLKDIELSGGFEWTPGSPWPPEIEHSDYYYDYKRNDPDRENPFTDPKDRERAFKVTGNWEERTKWIYTSPDGGKTVYRHVAGRDQSTRELIQPKDDGAPFQQEFLADNDDNAAHHFVSDKEYSINKTEYKKYEEDKGIKDLQDYVTSTYNGHYTSKGSNVQTLDLIESVGDAEAFCRSNAIKYLSRYDKKGQAKRDILKAMHYCLLLYYFSGHTTDETPTRGYETF